LSFGEQVSAQGAPFASVLRQYCGSPAQLSPFFALQFGIA